MSIATQHFLYCDSSPESCPLDGQQAFPAEGLGTKAELWAHARNHGWTRKGTQHYCPECSRAPIGEATQS